MIIKLQHSFLGRLQLQPVCNFMSKIRFQNFLNRFVTANRSRGTHHPINGAGNEVGKGGCLPI